MTRSCRCASWLFVYLLYAAAAAAVDVIPVNTSVINGTDVSTMSSSNDSVLSSSSADDSYSVWTSRMREVYSQSFRLDSLFPHGRLLTYGNFSTYNSVKPAICYNNIVRRYLNTLPAITCWYKIRADVPVYAQVSKQIPMLPLLNLRLTIFKITHLDNRKSIL